MSSSSISSSKRVQLRSVRSSDFEKVFNWENNPENWIQSGVKKPYTIAEIKLYVDKAEELFSDGQTRFMIDLLTGGTIGCVDLFDLSDCKSTASVGVLIDEKFRGKGYAKEALFILSKIATEEYNLEVLKALVLSVNLESVQLFMKSGFQQDKKKTSSYLYSGIEYEQLEFIKKL